MNNSLQISFPSPVSVVTTPQILSTFSGILVTDIIESVPRKIISARVKGFGPVTVWQGTDYDQWSATYTNDDLMNALSGIFTTGTPSN